MPCLERVLQRGAGDEEAEIVAVELRQGAVQLRVPILQVLRLVHHQAAPRHPPEVRGVLQHQFIRREQHVEAIPAVANSGNAHNTCEFPAPFVVPLPLFGCIAFVWLDET